MNGSYLHSILTRGKSQGKARFYLWYQGVSKNEREDRNPKRISGINGGTWRKINGEAANAARKTFLLPQHFKG